jgi:hypothetical protein
MEQRQATYTAFSGHSRIATGPLPEVAARVKQQTLLDEHAQVFVFANMDGKPVDLDLRGSITDVLARLAHIDSEYPLEAPPVEAAEAAPRGPGRPRLGVVAREVTLLPRHWDWLAGQPGGASVALRKLVDTARKQGAEADRARRAREAAYHFMSAMAGNQPGFEEAARALFAGDAARFQQTIAAWPVDIRDYAIRLAYAHAPAQDAAAEGTKP